MVKDVFFLCGTVENNVLFLFRQIAEGHVGAHTHLTADIGHQGPHQTVPRSYRTVINGKRIIRHQRCHIHCADTACAAAFLTGALRVKRQFLGGWRIKMSIALRAHQLLSGGNQQGGPQIMPVGAAMIRKAGVHEPQTVQKLRSRAEGAPDAGYPGTLVQCERGGDIQHLVHTCLGCLRHAAARVGGQCLQITPRPFGIQHAQSQRGLAGAGHTGNADNFIQRYLYINVF